MSSEFQQFQDIIAAQLMHANFPPTFKLKENKGWVRRNDTSYPSYIMVQGYEYE